MPTLPRCPATPISPAPHASFALVPAPVPTTSLLDLPAELLGKILGLAAPDPEALGRLRPTCTRVAKIVDDHAAWNDYLPPSARGPGPLAPAARFNARAARLEVPSAQGGLHLPDKARALRHLYALAASDERALTGAWQAVRFGRTPPEPARYFRFLLDGGVQGASARSFVRDETYARVAFVYAFFCTPPAGLGMGRDGWQAALLRDYDVARALLDVMPYAADAVAPSLREDARFVRAAVAGDGAALRYVAMPNDAELASALVRRPSSWARASADQRARPALVALAVARDPAALASADPSLRADAGFVLQCMRTAPQAYLYAAPSVQACLPVALAAVQADGNLLAQLPLALRACPRVVRAAVRHTGQALAHASDALRDDARIVRAAVETNGTALAWASARLRADVDTVRRAVAQHGGAVAFAAPELAALPEIYVPALQNAPAAYNALPGALRGPQGPALAALVTSILMGGRAEGLSSIAVALPPQDVLTLFLANPSAGLRVDAALHDDAGFANTLVATALKEDGLSLRLFAEAWASHPRYVALAVQQNGLALAFAGARAQGTRALVAAAVRQNGLALAYASPALQADGAVVRLAAAQNPLALEFADASARGTHARGEGEAHGTDDAGDGIRARQLAHWQFGRALLRSHAFAERVRHFLSDEYDRDEFYPPLPSRTWGAALGPCPNVRVHHHTWADLDAREQFAPLRGRASHRPPAALANPRDARALGASLPPPLLLGLSGPVDLVPAGPDAPLTPRYFSSLPFCGEMACAGLPPAAAGADAVPRARAPLARPALLQRPRPSSEAWPTPMELAP